VLADVAAGAQLLAVVLGEQLGVPAQRRGHRPQRRAAPLRPAGERRGQVGEQPRAAEAAAADDDAVAAGLLHHRERILGGPDVPVAQHRHLGHDLPQPGDRRPVGGAGVELDRGPGVQGDRGGALPLGGPAGLEVGQVVVVDALAHLHGDRDAGRRGGPHRGTDDRGEQVQLPRQRGAAALAGDLGDRAAEVEVDVVGAVLVDEHPHRRADRDRVDAVQLHAARGLVGVVPDQPHRLRRALDQRPGGDHLADVHARAELPAQPAERLVGDPGHRRQHHRGVDDVRPDPQRARRGGGGRHACHCATSRSAPPARPRGATAWM
jgi:hypothetical protein